MNNIDTLLLMDYALLCFAMATGTMLQYKPIKFLIKTPVIIFILVIVVRDFGEYLISFVSISRSLRL